MADYLWQWPDWPKFRWNQDLLAGQLAAVRHRQGLLLGRMESIGLSQRDQTTIQNLTLDVAESSGIEGEVLNLDQVRSSIARRLGVEMAGLVPADCRVEGVVEMTLEATLNYEKPLTVERLLGWHASLFPAGTEGANRITIGAWRDDASGPMQVVSGAMGRESIHFEAPPAERIPAEIAAFLEWANRTGDIDPVLRAAQAHLWFVTIHPFDDGNGRIARAIADWALARSENSSRRFYSMSAQIRKERRRYYDALEMTQRGTLDITGWMRWFLSCLDRAIGASEESLSAVFRKDRFWKSWAHLALNERQRLMLNRLLDGLDGKLTSSTWAKLAGCSQDTAQRDIVDLIGKGILVKDAAGGRSTSYSLRQALQAGY